MPLNLKVTTAGRAALVNANNTGTAPVTITDIGLSESAVVPAAAATTLPGEFKRLAGVAGDVVAADTMHVNVTDGSADTYALRAFALYLGDGTLFAIYGQEDPFLEKTAQSVAAISIDAIFADIDAALLTFGDTNFLNPPATTERAGVVELLTSVEAIAGADTDRVATAKAVKDAVTAWLDARFGANNSGIWHPGNDGSGSGLDADLLDGKQAAAFLLYANYNGAEILTRLVTADGAGSGLDADTLDGFHASHFMPKGGGTFTGPVNGLTLAPNGAEGGEMRIQRGTESGVSGDVIFDQLGNQIRLFVEGSGFPTFAFDYSNGSILVPGGTVWTSRNDGAGSGMDADTLDGYHASAFLPAGNYTASDVRAKLLTVDGSGSGIDADTLDGLHANSFLTGNDGRLVRAAGYAAPTSSLIYNAYNVSSITYSSTGGSGNGARAIVAYTNPIPNSVPVAMGGDTSNSSSSHSTFWGSGSGRTDNGFTACFGVSGGGGLPRLFSFITVGT